MARTPEAQRLDSVQILRGIAALAVVFNHAALFLAVPAAYGLGKSLLSPSENVAAFGGIGVDLFFVISGFVMALSASRFAGPGAAGTFLSLRFVRIAPLFYLLSLVMLLGLLRSGVEIDPSSLWNTLTFIPVFDDRTYSWPIHYLGWTLAFEFIFYLFVAVLIAARRGADRWLLLGLVTIAPLIGLAFDSAPIALAMMTNPILLEFGFGIVACMLWERGLLARWRHVFAVLAIAALVMLGIRLGTGAPSFLAAGTVDGSTNWQRMAFWGLPMFLLFCWIVGVERVGSGWLMRLMRVIGDASYSIYLSHLAVVRVMEEVMKRKLLPADLAILVTMAGSIVVGYVCYRLLEKPMLGVGQRLIRRWTPARAAAAA